jgi:hypothetical protein
MKKIFIFSFLIMWILSCMTADNGSANFTTINTRSNTMLKRIGEEFELMISIEEAQDVVGLNAWIEYDPLIVEVVDSDPVTPLTQVIATDHGFFPNPQLLVSVQNDGTNETPGTIICGYVTLPPTLTSGSGDAFSVRFRAIATGTTNIDFATGHVNLQDLDGDVPVNTAGDTVEVPVTATVRITVM